MRAFLEMLGRRDHLAELGTLAARLAPGELDALRAEGFLQPIGTRGFEEVSVPDVIRALRALWGAGSGGVATRATMSHAPMHLGWLEVDDEPCELVLVADDPYALAATARRGGRVLVLVPTGRVLTADLRRRHGTRARVRFVVLDECLGAHGGRVCRVDLPAPMPPALPPRALVSASQPGAPARPAPAASSAPVFDGRATWEELEFLKLDNRTLLVRFERRSRRLSAQDLGLAGARSRQPRAPFEMLLAFCENDGWLKTRRFGTARATKTTLSRLRAKLRAAFGVDADPFHEFKPGTGWRARFRVADGQDERERDMSPGARAVLERAGKVRPR